MTGIPFIFDGIPSEMYGLSIVSINNNSYEYKGGGGTEFITDTINRNPEMLFLDAKQSPILSFPLEIMCEYDMGYHTLCKIKDWLFGQYGYKKLTICLNGLETYYFNCKFKPDNDYIFVDGFRAFNLTVECDSPYAWEDFTKIYAGTNTTGTNTTEFTIYNDTSEIDGSYPIVEFTTMNTNTPTNFTLTNTFASTNPPNVSPIIFEFKDVMASTTVTCDCKNEIITSNSGLSYFQKFNKNFFRLDKGVNNIVAKGDYSTITISYKCAKRLGGGLY